MSHSLLFAFVVFGAVMAFTPGPNNIMVLSSGLTQGLRRTLSAIAGIGVGVCFMVVAVGLGLDAVFLALPTLQIVLKYAGAAYLIYLAATIALSRPILPDQNKQRGPMTFWRGAIFQWVNILLRPLLSSPGAMRAFNIVMALLLLVSLYPVFTDA